MAAVPASKIKGIAAMRRATEFRNIEVFFVDGKGMTFLELAPATGVRAADAEVVPAVGVSLDEAAS